MCTIVSWCTVTGVAIDVIHTGSSMLAGKAETLINVCETKCQLLASVQSVWV